MGCIQSKLFYCVKNEKEDEGVFESDVECKLDVVHETKSRRLIGVTKQSAVTDHENEVTIATIHQVGVEGERHGVSTRSHNPKDKDEDVMAKRMQLLNDVADLQMLNLRLAAREELHRVIIHRDAMMVVETLRKMPAIFDDDVSQDEKSKNIILCHVCGESEDIASFKDEHNNSTYIPPYGELRDEVACGNDKEPGDIQHSGESTDNIAQGDRDSNDIPPFGELTDNTVTEGEGESGDITAKYGQSTFDGKSADGTAIEDERKDSKGIPPRGESTDDSISKYYERKDSKDTRPLGESDNAIELEMEMDQSSAQNVANWLIDSLLSGINFDIPTTTAENVAADEADEEEEEENDEFTELPNFNYFQFMRNDISRKTIRKPGRLLSPSSISMKASTEVVDHQKKVGDDKPETSPSSETDLDDDSVITSSENGPTPEMPSPKDNDRNNLQTESMEDLTSEPLVLQEDGDNDVDNDNDCNDGSEDNNDDNALNIKRLQWLANRKMATNLAVNAQPIQTFSKIVEDSFAKNEQPTPTREIDIDSALARKRFPWMR